MTSRTSQQGASGGSKTEAPRKKRKVRFIAVAGNMGAGKSTLVEFLERRFGIEPFYEPNESNPYLKDFYGDMRRWAFQSQVYFLTSKFAIHQQISHSKKTVVQDRTIYEDAEIFAENLYRSRVLPKRDYLTYRALYENIIETLEPPDLLVYLRCSVRAVRKRIRLRARPEEQQISPNYVKRLHSLYENWFERYNKSPTMVVDTEHVDYVHDLVHRIDLIESIESVMEGRTR